MIVPPIMPPVPPKTTVQRFRKFGMFYYCEMCGMEMSYCKGHALPEPGAGDGSAESDLIARIREARQQQGGR
jgi:hypothetical protein